MTFENTIEKYGDEATMDMIIQRTIDEYCDDSAMKIGQYAFCDCTKLTKADLPNVTTVESNAFFGCSSLTEINIPNVTTVDKFAFQDCTALAKIDLPNITEIPQQTFQGCASLIEANIPNVTTLGGSAFRACSKLSEVSIPKLPVIPSHCFYTTGLKTAYFPLVTRVDDSGFWGCSNLTIVDLPACVQIGPQAFFQSPKFVTLILRSNTVCVLQNVNAFTAGWDGGWTGIKRGDGYIYVPRSLVDSYKAASNWSTYADQFRALEDYTVDGTTTGAFAGGIIHTHLDKVALSNSDRLAIGSYQSSIVPIGNGEITEVTVTMDGVDITDSVYSNGVINIPVVVGDVYIIAKSNSQFAVESTTLNGAASGKLPLYRLNVKAGQKLRIYYNATVNGGYLYDGRNCNNGFKNSGYTLNADSVQDVTIAKDGIFCFSCYYADVDPEGTVTTRNSGNDAFTGRYIYVEILE